MGPADRGPHTSLRQEQSSYAARRWRGQSSPTANSPAVISSLRDLLNLAHTLHYLVGPLVGASDCGGANGEAEVRVDGVTPVEATATLPRARTSITELW